MFPKLLKSNCYFTILIKAPGSITFVHLVNGHVIRFAHKMSLSFNLPFSSGDFRIEYQLHGPFLSGTNCIGALSFFSLVGTTAICTAVKTFVKENNF